jgi:hypothetical protein
MNDCSQHGARPASSRLTIKNSRAARLTLVIEPVAREYTVEPKTEVEIVEEGAAMGSNLEIHVEEHCVVVWTRPSTTVRILKNGQEI